jgi:hypothetical protein
MKRMVPEQKHPNRNKDNAVLRTEQNRSEPVGGA